MTPQTVNHGADGTLVTATPNANYHFVSWSDGNSTAARTDLNVTANKSVSATFAINTYTLTYTAGSGGSIVATTPQTVNHGAAGTLVTATPAIGYHFLSWSDGYSSGRTDLNVTANISVTATFEIDSTAKAITAFSFASPTATGVITESTHTIAVSVPTGTDVTALVALHDHWQISQIGPQPRPVEQHRTTSPAQSPTRLPPLIQQPKNIGHGNYHG